MTLGDSKYDSSRRAFDSMEVKASKLTGEEFPGIELGKTQYLCAARNSLLSGTYIAVNGFKRNLRTMNWLNFIACMCLESLRSKHIIDFLLDEKQRLVELKEFGPHQSDSSGPSHSSLATPKDEFRRETGTSIDGGIHRDNKTGFRPSSLVYTVMSVRSIFGDALATGRTVTYIESAFGTTVY
ncbi:hypothetical protein C8R42DRAFT_707646 [Lentinula raphanica]|nr:hypothetical protein C8R42DRAFT_707646 [Lentinula raphanica]